MNNKNYIDVLMVKAREHKAVYAENIEDLRIGYLDAVLHKSGISTRILDFAFSTMPYENDSSELYNVVVLAKPKVIVFVIDKSPTNSPAYTLELLDGLSGKDKKYHITLYGNTQVGCLDYFQHRVDSIILGEEDSALSLVRCVLTGESINKAAGVAFLDAGENITVNKAVQMTSLDDLPNPTRYAQKLIGKEQYAASILSSRGCFGRCSYCYLRAKEKYFLGYTWRGRSVSNVIDEIEQLVRQGISDFFFIDDEFIPFGIEGSKRAFELSGEIKRRKLDIHYAIYSRADSLSEPIVSELRSSGLYCVFLGVESFSQQVLTRYNKGISSDKNIKAINLLKKYDIHIRLGTILFDSKTTMAELRESIDALVEVSNTKPELLFQPLFFSNVLIPLADTPSEKLIEMMEDNLTNSGNELLQSNWVRRGRNTTSAYKFADPQINVIYSCVELMSKQLLNRCFEQENLFYQLGFTESGMRWINYVTKFAISQLEYIVKSVSSGVSQTECNRVVKENIDMFSTETA